LHKSFIACFIAGIRTSAIKHTIKLLYVFTALRSHVVCLSVRLSVTLVDCDHVGWNSSKIISPLVSLGGWDVHSLQPQHDGSAPRGTPLNLGPK